MPKFIDNFSFIDGDVIYGDREDRKKYKNAAEILYDASSTGKAALKAVFDDVWVTIDQYNNTTFLPFDERPGVLQTIAGIAGTLPRERATRYVNAFFDHPSSTKPTTLTSQQRTKESSIPTARDYDLLALQRIRRSCKFGVLNLAQALGTRAKIHFVLDSLQGDRMRQIVHKEAYKSNDMMRGGGTAVPVTTSELRAVYREQKRLKTPVLFYRNLEQVPPPWEEDAALWQQYAKVRYLKYKTRMEASMPVNPTAKAAALSMLQRAQIHADADDFLAAVDLIREFLRFGLAVATPLPDDDGL
ncbi:hypothetical protein H681_14925 [Pseudomonas sp. ATCC 13867]|uniref:hypothetical protein n=1 Tax=Pseudomonas sp. ATCC 13867 TaxID=1294143 RepID=UPI0002C4F48F|nr:hypothetical protein [Pseudomonas sp. ATCC 13867]AGI24853.1 hypothetical protein H681_14925 [Pseudomonas sp. ATCC 13867]RFQ33540.1 hypothetical protein D0N87_13105 [Pseudomonas sp. ATCC 13867]